MSFAMYNRLRVHVNDSDMKVIRAVRKRIKKKVLRDPKFRDARKALYRDILREHAEARELVRYWRF